MSIKVPPITIDVNSIAESFGAFKMEVEQDLKKGFQALALSTNAYFKEIAAAKLGPESSRWLKFKENIWFDQIDESLYVVGVKAKGLWVEEGLPVGFDMKKGMLNSPKAKTSKDGHRYMIVPFEHSKPPKQTNDYGKDLITMIKSELKTRAIKFKGLEKHANGAPKLGKLHSFDINGKQLGGKTVAEGDLDRVSIYQKQNKETGKVQRGIFTFRTVTDKSPDDSWIHPGLDAEQFIEKTREWAMNHWETVLLPDILKAWK